MSPLVISTTPSGYRSRPAETATRRDGAARFRTRRARVSIARPASDSGIIRRGATSRGCRRRHRRRRFRTAFAVGARLAGLPARLHSRLAYSSRAVIRLLCRRRRFPRSDRLAVFADQSRRAARARLGNGFAPPPHPHPSAPSRDECPQVRRSSPYRSRFRFHARAPGFLPPARFPRAKRISRCGGRQERRDVERLQLKRAQVRSLRATFITCREHIGSQSPSTCQLYATTSLLIARDEIPNLLIHFIDRLAVEQCRGTTS